MQELFPAIALIGVIYASYRFYKWLQAQPQRRDDLYYKNACNSIHALEEMVEELEALDEIITDLHTCNHKYLKGVRLSVPSALGHDNEYTILADCLELYNGSTENFIKDGFNITVKAREQFKEFKKDYPGLYAALDAYIREQVPVAAELKANQLHKPITTMNDLLHSQYTPIIKEFDFDNIRLQELFPTDSEEDYITRRKILNGVAILSEPVNAFHKATDYKGGIFAPEEFVTAFISFKDLIEKTEASKFVISAYESLENACRMIYAYNAFCEILLDLFDLPFLTVVYEDISYLEQRIETANKLIYSIYLDPPGSPIRKEQARKAMKEMLKPIDCETFKPAKWKVERLRSRMFFALQESFEEIRGYLIASRQLMKQLAQAEEEEGAE